MTTSFEVILRSDDPKLMEQVEAIKGDRVAEWKMWQFLVNLELEKAIRAQALRDHYDAIHMRARATRQRNKEKIDG